MAIDTKFNNVFIEGKDFLPEWEADDKSELKILTILKSYLELDNVSFLFGAGASVNLGSVSIVEKTLKLTIVKRFKLSRHIAIN